MLVRRSAAEVIVHAPAKVNLFFEVLRKRVDGYHEIETLMCPVDLYDSLHFTAECSERIDLVCERVVGARPSASQDVSLGSHQRPGDRLAELPEGRDNLVVQAVERLRRRAGVSLGAAVRLVKRIPLAAGLGGGSSDAAAALLAANLAWGLGRSKAELAEVGAEVGSDVPFFLAGGPAVCRGRGELVQPVPLVGALDLVVVCPPAGLATAAVYGACHPVDEPRPLAPLLSAAMEGNKKRIGQLLFNRLQPAAAALSPWIDRLRQVFAGEDVLGHGMSGSGTSYYGLCRHAGHAQRLARRVRVHGVGDVFTVRSCR